MRKNLQSKVISLFNRRDQLEQKLQAVITGSEFVSMLEDDTT